MGSPPVRIAPLLLLMMILLQVVVGGGEGAQWCVARSGASEAALQAALDYACGAGSADCQPVQPSGLCYLPNTLAAHASYAFNSFYQRSRAAHGACDFAGAATVSITDPSNYFSPPRSAPYYYYFFQSSAFLHKSPCMCFYPP